MHLERAWHLASLLEDEVTLLSATGPDTLAATYGNMGKAASGIRMSIEAIHHDETIQQMREVIEEQQS